MGNSERRKRGHYGTDSNSGSTYSKNLAPINGSQISTASSDPLAALACLKINKREGKVVRIHINARNLCLPLVQVKNHICLQLW